MTVPVYCGNGEEQTVEGEREDEDEDEDDNDSDSDAHQSRVES